MGGNKFEHCVKTISMIFYMRILLELCQARWWLQVTIFKERVKELDILPTFILQKLSKLIYGLYAECIDIM